MNYLTTSYLVNFRLKLTRMKSTIFRYLYALCLVLMAFTLGSAQNIPPRPNPPKLVNDFANVLSPEEERALEQKLVQFNDSTSTQVAVITLNSLEGYTVEEVAHKFLRDWGVGQKNKNNGVVLLAAIQDRKINIQTGLGMEGVLPDLICKRIITKYIIPAFKQQQYYRGFDDATTEIIRVSKNEYTNDASSDASISDFIIVGVILLIFLFIIIAAMRRKSQGTIVTRRGYTNWDGGGWWYMPRNNNDDDWDDHRGGGGGGWDFGGFGGGDGGGGGASGSW